MTRQQAVAKIGAHAPATEAGDSASPGVSTQKAGRGRDPAQTKRQAVASAESEAGPGGREDSAGSEKLGVKRDLEAVPSHAAHADSLCTVYSPSLDSNGEQATQSSDHSLISQRGSPESRETDGQLGREGPDACEAGAVSRGNEVLHDEDECRARRLRRTASVSSGSSGCALFSDEATDEGEEEDVLAAFVRRMGGTHVIRRILIANNGTAAVRCIRSMRHWAYEALGNSKALEFVVMATAADIDANAEFIAEADFYVEVPPGPNSNNYANLHLIVQTAETYECDAVWPGWGHASENHRLPAILQTLKRKTIWIGPSPQAMLALGDKIGSAVIAQSVNVPCVPWSGMDVTVDLSQVDPTKGLSQQTLAAACVQSAKDVLDCCAKIGYPVMIKASEGGGGKGIRRVTNAEEVADAYRQVVNEVKGSPVFVMRMVSDCRHLEVQLLADKSGRCVSLGSRDCSIQRRCQKIIEEGPVVAAPPEVVSQMEDAACRMAMAVGYENAGTCEFLYDPKTHQFAFLEVNARLQVEHVVTECVGDFNLPAAQLQVAMGILIDDIPDIKAYLDSAASNKPVGKHIIAARITAEHAEESFRPTVGLVHELTFRPSRFVWGYFSIGSKGNIHAFNDAQFGHLFAHGKDRREAVKHMVLALKDMTIRGELRTNVEALIKILEHPDFVANETHTTWLEQKVNFSSDSNDVSPVLLLGVLLAAVFESYTHFRESEEAFVKRVEQGQLPPSIAVSYESCLVYRSTKFTLQCTYGGQNTVCVALNDSSTTVHIRRITSAGAGGSGAEQRDGGFLVRGGIDGKSRKVYYKEDSTGLRVSFDGTTYTFTKESDPTQVRPPVSGKLVRWLVANEQQVVKGQSYAEIEIMKMYMQLHVEASGKLMHAMSEGAVFQAGDLLATLELPPGVTVPKATPFQGRFPSSTLSTCEEHPRTRKLAKLALQREEHQRRQRMLNPLPAYRTSREQLVNALDGYQIPRADEDEAIACFFECILNPMLPISEAKEVLAVIDSQLPEPLTSRLRSILADAEARAVAAFGLDEEPAARLSTASVSSQPPAAPNERPQSPALPRGATSGSKTHEDSRQRLKLRSDGCRDTGPKLEDQDTTPGTPDGAPARSKGGSEVRGARPVEKASKARTLSLASHLPPFLFSFPPFALELPVDECFAAVERQLSLQAGEAATATEETEGPPKGEGGVETPHSPAAVSEYVGVCVTRAQLQPLFDCLRKYDRGLIMAAAEDIARLLEKYLEVEELFEDSREGAAKSISMKRTEVDSAALASLQRSHQALKRKNRLLARLFEFIRKCPVWQSPVFLQRYMRSYSHFMESLPHLHDCLQRLSTLGGGSPEYSAVSLPARQLMLIKRRKPLEEQVRHVIHRIAQLANCARLAVSPTSPLPSSSAAAAAAAAAVAASAAASAAAAA
ncbi:acetyl-coA carboxylase ACC2, partial [Toxoplasma gondii GAB2-2007-GAL-DOM2]